MVMRVMAAGERRAPHRPPSRIASLRGQVLRRGDGVDDTSWEEWRAGIREMRHVAGRLVVFTYDPGRVDELGMSDHSFPIRREPTPPKAARVDEPLHGPAGVDHPIRTASPGRPDRRDRGRRLAARTPLRRYTEGRTSCTSWRTAPRISSWRRSWAGRRNRPDAQDSTSRD